MLEFPGDGVGGARERVVRAAPRVLVVEIGRGTDEVLAPVELDGPCFESKDPCGCEMLLHPNLLRYSGQA